jgi:hypothetical protein
VNGDAVKCRQPAVLLFLEWEVGDDLCGLAGLGWAAKAGWKVGQGKRSGASWARDRVGWRE